MYSKGSNTGAGSPSGGGRRQQRSASASAPPRWIFKILWVATLIAAGAVAFANIRPYVNLIKHLGLRFLDKFLIQFIASIPIINALAAAGVGLVTLISGIALWAVFQIIEVLPVVLYNHAGFLEEVISDAESGRQYVAKPEEDSTIRGLKQIYNKLPVAFLENLAKVRMTAYALDACICFWSYSPVKSGNIADFFYFLVTGQWGKIDFSNLLLALTTLFGVEIGVMLLLWIGKFVSTMQKATDKL